jgi:hypothetical protein
MLIIATTQQNLQQDFDSKKINWENSKSSKIKLQTLEIQESYTKIKIPQSLEVRSYK